jgi:hypothetical protein
MSDNGELKKQIEDLKAQNSRLNRELEWMRIDRDEYRRGYFELMPPIHFPSEQEMAAQLPNVVPFSVVMQDVDRILNGDGK